MRTKQIGKWNASVGCGWSETYMDVYTSYIELYHFGYRNPVRRWRIQKSEFLKVIKGMVGTFDQKMNTILNDLWRKRDWAPKEFKRIR